MATEKSLVEELADSGGEYVQSPDHRFAYINSLRLGISPWDIRLICATAKEIRGATVQEDQVTIVMSPQHAKSTLQHLARTIATYEATFGEIPDLNPILEGGKKGKAAAEDGKSKSEKKFKSDP